MFLKDHWYVACTAAEIGATPLGRILCGVPVAIYRTESGKVHALQDACPHRKAPLSMGLIQGEKLRCIYHGMTFDGGGKCVHIPSQDQIPARAQVHSFPVAQKYGLVWIWPGDAALADPALIPARPWLEDEGWNHDVIQYFPVKSAYTLMNDNLLDLSHVAFLHASSIGFNPDLLENDPLRTVVEESSVTNERVFRDTDQAPAHKAWHDFGGKVTRVQQSQWTPPANVTVLVRNEDASRQVDMRADHFMTPETESTHHYFIVISRNFRIDDAALSKKLDDGTRAVHLEDVDIAQAQQRNAALLPDMMEMPLRADKAVVAANRILTALAQKQATPNNLTLATQPTGAP